jgi:hypothetical protein
MTASVYDFRAIADRMKAPNDQVELQCKTCGDGDGWICYGTGDMDPHFRECDDCRNPNGRRSP